MHEYMFAWVNSVCVQFVCVCVCICMRVLSVYRALQAVWGIEDHSNLDPVVTDPALFLSVLSMSVWLCVDADISFLSVVCQM